ncbi:hypothetical protein BP5796_04479 [Coleophoma crateriformis]|uniref:DUF1479-domain-containing protein n=1 Tax=Coleophoma crateriformis TaxID=565419 RepID=A0A3D8SB28_9HELO|nr:hypothetical protein BP5796_04479 [Coleophoma crateriformis]
MPSRTSNWPSGWPTFSPSDNEPNDTFQAELKASIIAEYGPEALRTAWIKTCNALKDVTARIAKEGNNSVPVFSYEEVTSDHNELVINQMKATGCFIIRNVIPSAEASQHFSELQAFIASNRDTITGWPAKSVAIYHLFSTPTQLKIKTTPKHLRLQKLLNSLYTDSSCSLEEQEAKYDPILYPDAVRIRAPGQEFLGLGPHIDSGSLVRWSDRSYRQTYAAILSGSPETYDPFDMAHRQYARTDLFPGGAHSSVFRSFQGWTALTKCESGKGGLLLLPDIKTVTAYMILRPFFTAPKEEEWRDAEKWTIDESGWFPGTYRWDSQLLSRESHPHLCLEETLVSIPDMEPGDTVWWHADMCHAVETTHTGTIPASVCYIPSSPSTTSNLAYIRQHWKDLVAGIPPDDYKYLDGTGSELVLSKQNERELKGALSLDLISAEGRRGLGEGV